MKRPQFEKEVNRIFDEAKKILIEKNRLYASREDCLSNFRHGGIYSVALRIAEKSTRLTNLAGGDPVQKRSRHIATSRLGGKCKHDKPKRIHSPSSRIRQEGLLDTLMDGLNYHVLALLMLREKK